MKIWDHARLYLALNEFEPRIMFSVFRLCTTPVLRNIHLFFNSLYCTSS